MRGNGIFSKLDTSNLKSIKKNAFELSRCTPAEVDIMNAQNKEATIKLVTDKISKMF
jgi:hypothetical protein